MCGIFGCINKNIDDEFAKTCLNSLQHRGPDGWGIWQEGETTLGHRRLSILDLSENGKQPMSYANERYWLTFNGEIYNFIEVREQLKYKGYTFKSDTDSEVILAAFCEWKEECLDKFNGMWALAIWDRLEKKLFLSRDRFGVKPLYYMAIPGGGIAFASEMKALLPFLPNIEPNMKLISQFKYNPHYESEEDCVICGIKRFPAGSFGWIDHSEVKLKRWWNTLDHLVQVPHSYEEQVELFRELFLNACSIRMRSDVTLGTALSGGLDSSATICGMAHIESKKMEERVNLDWQHAYVACFPGTALDERYFAQQVTDYLGIQSTFLNIDAKADEKELLHSLYLFEDLFINSPIPMMRIYSEERQHGTIVSIDGHGADELFGGYKFDVIKAFQDTHLSIENINMVAQAFLDIDLQYEKSNEFVNNRNRLYLETMVRYYGKKILRKPIVKSNDSNHPAWENMEYFNRVLYTCTHETVLPSLLRNYDRCSMASGVEIRMPFLDYRIVQLAFSIGFQTKLHGGYTKSIIRDAMAPFMPSEIAYRRGKIGFNAPMLDWIKGPYKELLSDTVCSKEFIECSLIEKPYEVKKRLDYVINSKNATFSDACKVWEEISLFLWEKAVVRQGWRKV